MNNNKLLLHIATDEKFINSAYEIYEKATEGNNKFLILVEDRATEVKHVNNELFTHVYLSEDYIGTIQEVVKKATRVVFHGMNIRQARIVNQIEIKVPKIWTVFGTEVYNNPEVFGSDVYGEKTFKEFLGNKYYLKNKFRSIAYFIKGKRNPYKVVLEALYKMDFVAVLFPEEFKLFMKKGIINDKAKHLKFSYYPLDIVISKEVSFQKKKNILLGNSASLTNNHLEAFDLLSKFDLSDRKIITPLSYGDMVYANHIKIVGTEIFKENFEPLLNFLSLYDYQKLLNTCGIVIMNHYRKQAGGNILNSLYMGAKVYLRKENVIYEYLKNLGCHVYNIENDLTVENNSALELLNTEEIRHNQKLLKRELSLERITNEIKYKLGL